MSIHPATQKPNFKIFQYKTPKKSAIRHSIEKPILLNFVNLSTTLKILVSHSRFCGHRRIRRIHLIVRCLWLSLQKKIIPEYKKIFILFREFRVLQQVWKMFMFLKLAQKQLTSNYSTLDTGNCINIY